MASSNAAFSEKFKDTPKNFFKLSDSAKPSNVKNVNLTSDLNSAMNDTNKKVIHRSSMICSEGFDKYIFDSHVNENVPTQVISERKNHPNQIARENLVFENSEPSSSENTSKKILFPISDMPNLIKNSLSPKQISEHETNKNVSYKRVPEETIPVNNLAFKISGDKSPVTNIPYSFNSSFEKTSMVNSTLPKSVVKPSVNSLILSKHVSDAKLKDTPLSSKQEFQENHSINKVFSHKNPNQSNEINDCSLKYVPEARISPINSTLMSKDLSNKTKLIHYGSFQIPYKASNNINNPLVLNQSEEIPVRNYPLSFNACERMYDNNVPVQNRSVKSTNNKKSLPLNNFEQPAQTQNVPLNIKKEQLKHSSALQSIPSDISTNNKLPLNYAAELAPIRNYPLSLKQGTVRPNAFILQGNLAEMNIINKPNTFKQASNESAFVRKSALSLKHFPTQSDFKTTPLSLQTVPEEQNSNSDLSFHTRNTRGYVHDETLSNKNSPLLLKPLSKHISLLKKNTPSFKKPIIKRDSVVHPERIDLQNSVCIEGRFQNPWPTWKPPTFTNILKFGVTRNKSKVPSKQELDLVLPIVKQDFSKLSVPEDGICVTWIGHSTVLIQMHGLNILTDPMFSERASPSQVVGPKRYRSTPCSIHDLPRINAVVISHSHYDHLDSNTITLLNARFGADIRWFVPLGLQIWMEQAGCENVVELDWWEENCVPEHSETSFIFTPTQHWSKRAIGDENKVLWGSWCILGSTYRFFFAGDTGYCDVFKQIGHVYGPFDLSAIPIGAYEPRWFMKHQHVNPEEAVKIHIDLKSKKSLAIHWGTFCLANEYYLDPPLKLRESLDKYEISPEDFFTLKHGESRLIVQNSIVKRKTFK